ncbi:hypothetical protein ACFY64_40185 [Streptomyces collinus]|uniref:hypothetical protein n=1 Tax=Streptomyces collinus TaxID=42684 RepID=UPI0036AFD20B
MACLVLPPGGSAEAEALAAARVFAIPGALLAPSVNVPGSAALGSAAPGQTVSVDLGQVRVTNGGSRNWTAAVSASDLKTGSGTALQTIPKDQISYWSGPLVSKTGPGTNTPGQPAKANKEKLNTQRVAFTYAGNGVAATATYRPSLEVSVPVAAVAGTYTGTLTHSVA